MKIDPKAYGTRGHWSAMDLPKGFAEKERELMRMSPVDLLRAWAEAGCKDISAFGIRWEPRGIDDDWLYLTNKYPMVPHQMVFSMAADPTNYSQYRNIKERMEKTAVLLAIHFGMQEYLFVPVEKSNGQTLTDMGSSENTPAGAVDIPVTTTTQTDS